MLTGHKCRSRAQAAKVKTVSQVLTTNDGNESVFKVRERHSGRCNAATIVDRLT
jgi:hypothetical protein